jgi:son of sevenless-like protein
VLSLYGIVRLGGHLYSVSNYDHYNYFYFNMLFQVSPWMNHGTAISYVNKYPQVDRLKLLTEVAHGMEVVRIGLYLSSHSRFTWQGLEYLHDEGIVHGDLRGVSA